MVKGINRECSICGKSILIKVDKNGKYCLGNFFGKIDRKTEYWECDKCYENPKEIVPIANEKFIKKLEVLRKGKFVRVEDLDELIEKR